MKLQQILLVTAIALGLALGYMDSRPTWNDTGITAGLVFVVAATLGALAPQGPWLWAICVGGFIPVFNIITRSNYGSLMALVFAFAGAYAGMWLRRIVSPA